MSKQFYPTVPAAYQLALGTLSLALTTVVATPVSMANTAIPTNLQGE